MQRIKFCTTVIFTYINRGNFERWGNFEHRSIFPFYDLYNRNGRVYQQQYFCTSRSSNIPQAVFCIVTICTAKMCTYEVKLWSQNKKPDTDFSHFLNCCQTSIWQHHIQNWKGIQLCGIAQSFKWQHPSVLAFANISQSFPGQ